MNVIGTLAVIVLLAYLVETLTEFVLGDLLEKIAFAKKIVKYVAILVAVGGAVVYRFDLIYLLGQFLTAPIAWTWFGTIITGVAIGKGSNYLHDLIQKYFVKPQS